MILLKQFENLLLSYIDKKFNIEHYNCQWSLSVIYHHIIIYTDSTVSSFTAYSHTWLMNGRQPVWKWIVNLEVFLYTRPNLNTIYPMIHMLYTSSHLRSTPLMVCIGHNLLHFMQCIFEALGEDMGVGDDVFGHQNLHISLAFVAHHVHCECLYPRTITAKRVR